MKRDYRHYILDILDSIKAIESFVEGYAFEDFAKDRKTVDAIIRNLEIIGEAAKNVPKDIKKKYGEIPWKEMAGMRDKLIHEYHGVDLEIIWKVVVERLPTIRPFFEKIAEEMKNETFSYNSGST
ncbi:MAG: DUF86 domain-containing protein [Candidatus Altiarchaeota archaeon]